jgi:hypothetical protein
MESRKDKGYTLKMRKKKARAVMKVMQSVITCITII